MPRPTPCPRCGAPLPAQSTHRTPCPRCLFELGMESDANDPLHPAPTPEELAPHFPQLEILELIGRGGMGAVYRARQKGLEREVALKILSNESAGDPAFAERFAREARTLAALSHPNITAVYDYGEAAGHYYLLLELVDGANLRQVLRGGGLAPHEALALVSQMCAALQYAHEHGIVHRDVKPENVLLDKTGKLKIADFGLAKLLGVVPTASPLTRTHQAMGTLHYMAPEQVERPLQVDHRADLFSLGVVFYELLTGELPLGHFAPPSQRAAVDVRLDEVVLKTLAKEPERRYQSAGALKTDVDTIATGPARRPQAAPASKSSGSGTRMTVGIGIGLVLVVLMVLGCFGFGAALLLGLRLEEDPVQPFTYPIDDVPLPEPPKSDSQGSALPSEQDVYAQRLLESAFRELELESEPAGAVHGDPIQEEPR